MQTSQRGGFWRWPEIATESLRREFPDIEIVELDQASDLPPSGPGTALETADAAIAVRLHPEWLRTAAKLRWLHCPSAAVHQLLTPELIASNVQVTNGAGVHAASVAEHGLALLLALLRGLPQAAVQQADRKWDGFALRPGLRELRGSTALIVGLGHIGRELATRLHALGVTVLGIRRQPMPEAGVAEVHPPLSLAAQLPRADHVILALPATRDTSEVIGAEQLRQMRPGSRLINVGRGSAVDETALAAALHSGHLAGAALDVTQIEPLPTDSPLWSAPRLLLTPHVAAVHPDTWNLQAEHIATRLRRFLAGEPPGRLVNKQLGY